jgi:hypothetical protein
MLFAYASAPRLLGASTKILFSGYTPKAKA